MTCNNFFAPEDPQQGANGVQTGAKPARLEERLAAVAATWRECDRLDVLLLRALCEISISHPESAQSGFTSPELVEAVTKIQGRLWSDPSDPSRMSDDVRRCWNRLQQTWASKKEGLEQLAEDEGWHAFPTLKRSEGGGTGRLTRYRIEWPSTSRQPFSRGNDFRVPSISADVRYICEDINEAGWTTRVFARGYFMHGWRKWAFLALVGFPTLLVFAVFCLLVFQLILRSAFGGPIQNSFVAFFLLLAIFLPTIGALLSAPERKIVVAPWWMQSLNNDHLLEHRSPPRYEQKSFKISRYTARCPLCSGTITARAGGLEFFGRIVGRCESSPQEHVYSFDHVTRAGKFLR